MMFRHLKGSEGVSLLPSLRPEPACGGESAPPAAVSHLPVSVIREMLRCQVTMILSICSVLTVDLMWGTVMVVRLK